MNKLIVVIIVHNERDAVQLTIESFRRFSAIEDLSVILVDNYSSDGLKEWAEGQTDFTYVLMDDQEYPIGYILNELIEKLRLQGDLLVMKGHFLITPGCLVHMQETLYEEEKVGIVGGLANSFLGYQRLWDVEGYEEAIMKAASVEQIKSKRVVGLCADAILFKMELLQEIGKFDEQFIEQHCSIRDYSLRSVEKDWKAKICNSAYMWNAYGANYINLGREEDECFLKEKWGMKYFNFSHNENIISLILNGENDEINVLEVGCDCGATLLEITNRYPKSHVYGCEINVKAASIASHFASVTVSNIENQDLPYTEEMFDYIIFGDVLEHLRDPLEVVKYCRCLLKKEGYILASIPNLMHVSVIENLLKGNFTYTEIGLLDKTHIHFFTYKEMIRMFWEGGYKVDSVGMIHQPMDESSEELIEKLLSLREGSDRFMYEAFQYLVRAQKLESSCVKNVIKGE